MTPAPSAATPKTDRPISLARTSRPWITIIVRDPNLDCDQSSVSATDFALGRLLRAGKITMEQRKSRRVVFERGYDAHMMAIDGTWRRACKIEDISDTGAKLGVEASLDGLPLKESFLLLSSTGLAFRRCELAWVNGDKLGVLFKRPGEKKAKNLRSLATDG